MFFIGGIQSCLTFFDNLISTSVMDILWSQKPDTGVIMLAVVPPEERLAE